MKLTIKELSMLKGLAVKEFVNTPPDTRIQKAELDADQFQAFAWYKAVVNVLNAQGAIKPEWLAQNGLVAQEKT